MADKRKDKNRIVLKKGESYREKDKRYSYRWTDETGKRHMVYAKTLVDLREKEDGVKKDVSDGIKAEAQSITLNQIYAIWKDVKRGLKNTTYQNYCYMYDMFVADSLGAKRICNIKKTDVKRFYNKLVEEDNLSISTVDSIHTVVHQLFKMAVEDEYIRFNPSDNALEELKRVRRIDEEKRSALTESEEKIFLNYLLSTPQYRHWYPIFAVMVGSGLRVGEITGLRWQDIDLENRVIDVNHTLVYYAHRIVKDGEREGCYYAINSTKTPASKRKVPMLSFVKEAFEMEKKYQEEVGIQCKAVVDSYTDFIFVNRFGNVQNQSTLNKALRRIIRDCNEERISEGHRTLLPKFSCHSLRHTFATRMCERDVNIKVIQDVLGHTDISTTMNIYTDATKDMKDKAFKNLDSQYEEFDAIDANFDAI